MSRSARDGYGTSRQLTPIPLSRSDADPRNVLHEDDPSILVAGSSPISYSSSLWKGQVHLVLDGGDISDRLQESLRVVPMDPLEGGELNVFETTPGPTSTDHLGLVEADDGFSQSVIVRVASAADGRLNTRVLSKNTNELKTRAPGRFGLEVS